MLNGVEQEKPTLIRLDILLLFNQSFFRRRRRCGFTLTGSKHIEHAVRIACPCFKEVNG